MTYVEILHPSANSSALGALYSGVLDQEDVGSTWEENVRREVTLNQWGRQGFHESRDAGGNQSTDY
jgi:hypothetical protein